MLFRTIIRSRELQRAKQVGSDVTSDSIEGAFKRELRGIFDEMNRIMELQAPASIIGTQVLAMQHFASIAESVERIFSQDELVDIISNFCEAISGCTGKLAVQKLLLLARLAEGPLLNSVNNRSTVVPSLLRWVRPHLARLNDFELRSMNDAARETAQTQWLEAARAATVVLAAMLHKINVAIYDTRATESLLASEQDNIEFMLALLPRLFEYYSVLRDPTVATLLERNPVQMAAADSPPSVFPTAHPLYLLSHPAATEAATSSPATLRHLRGELTAVLLSLFQMARPTVLTTFLDATLEVEGQDHFTRLLSDLFRFEKTVVEGDAFPGTWLNFNLLAHRVVLKITEVMAPLMQRHYIPASDSTYLFNFPLWREYLEALLALLKVSKLNPAPRPFEVCLNCGTE